MHSQPGIFALGTPEHSYLEFDLVDGADPGALVAAVVALEADLSTTGGVTVVVGVRPSLWSRVAPAAHAVPDVQDWTDDLVGPDGFTMPATPHDLWLWIAGGSRTAVFDCAVHCIDQLAHLASVAGELDGWLYRHDRDLTGFIDGTENPSALEAPGVVARPHAPGVGACVVLFQQWRHDFASWNAQSVDTQQQVMGRTKPESVELPEDEMPEDSHVSRTTVEVDGTEYDIFRRNVAYGGPSDHGTLFVGFAQDQWRLHEMLRRMTGIGDGIRCALTRYTAPLSGSYYVVPSVEALAALSSLAPAVGGTPE